MSGPPDEQHSNLAARRRWRRVALLTLAALVLLLSSVAGFVWRKTSPPPPIDAMPVLIQAREELQPPGDHEDAWPRYVEFFSTALGRQHLGDPGNHTGHLLNNTNFWSAVHREQKNADPKNDEARAAALTLAPIVDHLVRIADTPACVWPVQTVGGPPDHLPAPFANPPHVEHAWAHRVSMLGPLDLMHLQALLIFAAELAYQENDIDRGNARLRAAISVSMHMHQSAVDVIGLGVHGCDVGLELLRNAANTRDLTAEQADAMLDVLRYTPNRFDLAPMFRVLAVVEAAQFADIWSDPPRPGSFSEVWAFLTRPPPRAIQSITRDDFLTLAALADLPTATRPTLPQSNPSFPFDLSPNAGLIQTRDQYLTNRAATRIVLLLEKHHALTGKWPEALEEIMPLEDTLEPNTAEPFEYALTPDGPFPFSLRAPDETAAFLPEAADRDFTTPRPALGIPDESPEPQEFTP